MGQTDREQLDERIAHAYRVLAKQICAVAMTSWRRYYIKLMLMGDPETDRRYPLKQLRVVRHIRSNLNESIAEIEDFFSSDWYKDILVGMCPEMALCPFSEYKEKTFEDIRNGRITEADTAEE